jgi:hypothetical protein
MNRLALSPRDQIRLPKLDGIEPGTPSHRYHLELGLTICRFGDPAGLSRDDRTFNHQIAILRLKTEFSSTFILRPVVPVVPVVLVGLEAKPAGGWTNPAAKA